MDTYRPRFIPRKPVDAAAPTASLQTDKQPQHKQNQGEFEAATATHAQSIQAHPLPLPQPTRAVFFSTNVIPSALGSALAVNANTELIAACTALRPDTEADSVLSQHAATGSNEGESQGRLEVQLRFQTAAQASHADYSRQQKLDTMSSGSQQQQQRTGRRLGDLERLLSLSLSCALSSTIDLYQYPNAVIDLSIQVLRDDGSIFSLALCAASLALATSGIALNSIAAAVDMQLFLADESPDHSASHSLSLAAAAARRRSVWRLDASQSEREADQAQLKQADALPGESASASHSRLVTISLASAASPISSSGASSSPESPYQPASPYPAGVAAAPPAYDPNPTVANHPAAVSPYAPGATGQGETQTVFVQPQPVGQPESAAIRIVPVEVVARLCWHCGAQQLQGARFCHQCAQPQNQQ